MTEAISRGKFLIACQRKFPGLLDRENRGGSRVGIINSWLSAPEMSVSSERDIYLKSDDLKIHAVINCKGSIAGKPGAILIHGFHSDADELGGLARALALYGWAALRLDLRGNGFSDGHPDDINGFPRDVMRAVDYLHERGAGLTRLFAVGQSLGASVAITSTAADFRISGVVALHPSSKYELGSYDPPIGHADVRKPLTSVALISPRPLLIIAGERDWVLPCSSALELYNAASEPKRMLEVLDGTHAMEDTEAYALGWLLAGAPHN